jgi:hypothetical protein
MGFLEGSAMGDLKVARKSFALVAVGLALGFAGLVILSLATFQTRQTEPATSLSGPITLTFTVLPVPAGWAVFLAVLLAIPLILAFFPERFNLTALVAPAFVALSTVGLIIDTQLVTGLVVSSATWVFVADALVIVGCSVEAMGVVAERTRRTKSLASGPSRDQSSQSPVSRPP